MLILLLIHRVVVIIREVLTKVAIVHVVAALATVKCLLAKGVRALLDGRIWLPLILVMMDRLNFKLILLSLFGVEMMRRDILVRTGFKLLVPSLFAILRDLSGL